MLGTGHSHARHSTVHAVHETQSCSIRDMVMLDQCFSIDMNRAVMLGVMRCTQLRCLVSCGALGGDAWYHAVHSAVMLGIMRYTLQ